MHAVYIVSVWLHIVAVCLWLGGMLFLAIVIVPVLRMPAYRDAAAGLVRASGLRFRTVGWVCLGVVVLTGIYNLNQRGNDGSYVWNGLLWAGPQGRALSVKLTLVALVLALSLVHDWFLGPKASEMLIADPTSPAARRLRKTASWMGRLNALLGLAIVALAALYVRGGI